MLLDCIRNDFFKIVAEKGKIFRESWDLPEGKKSNSKQTQETSDMNQPYIVLARGLVRGGAMGEITPSSFWDLLYDFKKIPSG